MNVIILSLAGGNIFFRSQLGINGQVCPAQRADRPRGGRVRPVTLWPYWCAVQAGHVYHWRWRSGE